MNAESHVVSDYRFHVQNKVNQSSHHLSAGGDTESEIRHNDVTEPDARVVTLLGRCTSLST